MVVEDIIVVILSLIVIVQIAKPNLAKIPDENIKKPIDLVASGLDQIDEIEEDFGTDQALAEIEDAKRLQGIVVDHLQQGTEAEAMGLNKPLIII